MSAESRKKAEETGQKSGKGSAILSRALAKLTGYRNNDD